LTTESFIALVANATLMLSLVYVYDLLNVVRWVSETWIGHVIIGIAIGGLGIFVMLMPWTFVPGIIFDTRSVLLAISGLFFGTIPTLVAVLMTATYRVILGGNGVVMGVSIIIASGIIGVAWRHARKHQLATLSFGTLYSLGLVVHLVMLALVFTLPLQTAISVLRSIALPILVIYPVATAAYGTMMVERLRRNQAAVDVRESESRFRALFEQATIGVAKIEAATGQFVLVNQRYADIVGYSREELLSLDFQTITHPDDRPTDLLNTKRLASGQVREFTTQKRYLRKNGTQVWANLTISALWNPGEPPTYNMAMIEDVTEGKQAEDALASSLSLLKATMESTADGILVVDRNERITLWNQKFADMWQIPEEVMSKHADKLAVNYVLQQMAQPEAFLAKVRELYGQPEESSSDQLNLADGRIFRRYSQPQRIGDEVVGRVWSFSDITERKQAEKETRREQAFFNQLVETAPEGIAITGDQGRVLRVNAEFIRMFGYDVDEAVGQSIDNLVVPPARDEEARAITRSTSQGGEIRMETVRRRKDGSLVDVSLIVAPILIAGKQEAVYAIYRDNTERKQAEEAREKAEAQLRQSQKMEAIGTLAGGVAHDFNNLLTGILGNISLMRSTLPPADPLLENLDAAETSARQAADLTKGLLTFSRGAMVLPVPTNLTAALDVALALLKQSLPATMEIVRDYGRTVWNVLVDQSQMTQILLNLGVNARDAMKGKGTLTISVRNEAVGEEYVQTNPFARKGEFVHLSVTDTGAGIPPAILEHFFEPFHTTKPVGSGTGLGLSIVYGAVKQAGGWITAISTDGVGKTAPPIEQTCSGTTFDIYLPRCLDKPRKSIVPASIPVNAGNDSILVVEDEPVVCAVAKAFLNRGGYVVLTAPDGASALNVLHEHLTDIGLILLDMTMPGMVIDEIVKAIRALDPTVPILLNSGYTSNDTVKQMLAEGSVQGFLGKPYDPGQLLGAVQDILRTVRQSAAVESTTRTVVAG
jgi:PAS domain S-box-containing protein